MIHIDYVPPNKDFIDNGPIDEVIKLAKTRYNIFLPNNGKLYTEMCNKIKQRLDHEGLSYDVVRPD